MATNPAENSAQNVYETKTVSPIGVSPKAGTAGDIYDGIFLGLSGGKLVMSTGENQQYSFTVSPEAYVCCDGATCRPEDLIAGSKLRLTTQVDDKNVATAIETLINQVDFADRR